VRQHPDGSWWSDVNVVAQRLARDRVLASDDAERAWAELADAHAAGRAPAVHVWYADGDERDFAKTGGTVCAQAGRGGLQQMQATFPSATFRFFPNARHSIHNSERIAFVDALKDVIDDAAIRCTSSSSSKIGSQPGSRGDRTAPVDHRGG
jgi:hypothetical protein